LLFGHTNGDRLELLAKTTATQLLPAVAEAPHQRGFLTDPYLPHIDALVKLAREATYELTEVHPLVCTKIAHYLAAVEEVLDANRLHIKLLFMYEPAKDRHRLIPFVGQAFCPIEILGRSDAVYRPQRRVAAGLFKLLVRNLKGVIGRQSYLEAAPCLADDVVPFDRVRVSGIKPQVT
jgi:hypothetical protein